MNLSQVSNLANALRAQGIPTVILSIDDFYLTRGEQALLSSEHPSNPLIQHRGQPSTHDLSLALSVLSALQKGVRTRIPLYDKSAFSGQGDRVFVGKWPTVNDNDNERIKVVIFEGWCIGFRALDDEQLRTSWERAVSAKKSGEYRGRLGWNSFDSVQFVNNALRSYDEITK